MSGIPTPNYSEISDRQILIKQYTTPTTGSTVNVNTTGHTLLFLNPAGTLATLTVAFPVSYGDQDCVLITTSQIITSLTLSAAATIVGAITSMAVGDRAEYTYFTDSNSWIRTG